MDRPKDWAERLAGAEQLAWDFDPQGKLELVARLSPQKVAAALARIPARKLENELKYIEVDLGVVQ